MKILEIGGSGYVGGLINPYLKKHHELRVLDLKPPQDPDLEFVQGTVLDPGKIKVAMGGVEGLVYLAMGVVGADGSHLEAPSYDVNVKGLHFALSAAAEAGVRRAVYASTMSVYADWSKPAVQNETTLPNAPGVYGFTKRLGEDVCEWFARSRGLSSFALRLCGPLSDERWQETASPHGGTGNTSASDVARAFHLALEADHAGFTTLHITGDYKNLLTDLSRAKAVLGWEPLARPRPR